jgi:hypothetical protein
MSDTSDAGSAGGGSDGASYGMNGPTSPTSPFNSMRMAIDMAAAAKMTCTIVKVMKVTVDGAVGPIGRVDVQPMVQMVDGIQRTVDHVSVYNLPYFRVVGGKKAVILDPKKDDIGIVVVADRDISGVKQSKKVSPPGSRRKNNFSDGIFIGSVLAEKPSSYVRFVDDTTIEISPDGGKTAIWLRPNRIDLGMKDAPHAVATVDGPSQKVFAVISESGSED